MLDIPLMFCQENDDVYCIGIPALNTVNSCLVTPKWLVWEASCRIHHAATSLLMTRV